MYRSTGKSVLVTEEHPVACDLGDPAELREVPLNDDYLQLDHVTLRNVGRQDDSDQKEVNSVDALGGRRPTFTVEDAVENLGLGLFQLKIWFICGLFSASDALEMLLLAVLTPVLRCEWLLSDFQVAWISTVVFIGMFSLSSVWGSWADKYGRLSVMKIACVWILYFGFLTSFSPNYYWILILRGLVGTGFGGAVQSFTLMCEYFPSKHRAKILTIGNIMWASGSAFEVWLAYLIIPTYGWRWLVGLSCLPLVVTFFVVRLLPESARYLVAAGRKEEAMEVLKNAARLNKKSLPDGELVQSKAVVRGSVKDLFSIKYLRTSLQLWVLWFGAAFTYYGIVLASSQILEFHQVCGAAAPAHEKPMHDSCHCNLLSRSDYVIMIISTFGEFLAIPFNLLTIDWLGRKPTLVLNYLISAIFFMLVQICASRVWLTVFIFGVRTFTSGIFNTVYIYTSEVSFINT